MGEDVYEWRDGRALLISDGLNQGTSTTAGATVSPQLIAPSSWGVSAGGDDVFFTDPARLTSDAPDNYMRLYDARLGGGFEFPAPPPPCPLEVCQGTPKGAPDDPTPASRSVSSSGNVKAPTRRRCPKGKRKVRRGGKLRCVKVHHRKHHKAKHHKKAKHHRAANHKRRTHR